MNVLVISHEFPPIGGGGANACYNITRELKKSNCEVTVVTANYKSMAYYEVVDGVEVYRVNAKRKNKEHCSFMEMASFLLHAYKVSNELCKKNRYDICHIFFGIPSGPIGYILKKKYNIPYVIRFGGGDIPGFQERFQGVYKILAPFIRCIWKNANRLVANSQGLKDMAFRFYSKCEVDIIPNGVDATVYVPSIEKKDKNKITILFLSRLIERKGLQYIIPQWNDISANVNKEVTLLIVGDGPYRETLECLAKNVESANEIIFTGHKEKHELLNYYQQADLFILPSAKEGMPNVVLEAMACKLPIVMTPCEGSKELIDGNGIITKVDGFKEALIKLINDDIEREKMGKRSLELVQESFSWRNVAQQYKKIYCEVKKRGNGE